MKKYRTEKDWRNSPADDLEEAYAEGEVNQEVQKLYQRYRSEPQFFERIVLKIAKDLFVKEGADNAY